MSAVLWVLAFVSLLAAAVFVLLVAASWLAFQHEHQLALQRALVVQAANQRMQAINRAAVDAMLAETVHRGPVSRHGD